MEIRLKPLAKIPLVLWGSYSFLLFIVQIFQGSSVVYALNILLFHLCWGCTFNLLGGFSSVCGWLIFLWAARHVLISQFMKMYFGQAADQRLLVPEFTAMVYSLGMAGILLAVFLIVHFDLRFKKLSKPHVPNVPPSISWVLFCVGVLALVLFRFADQVPVFFLPIANLSSYLRPLTLLGLSYELCKALKRSKGRNFITTGTVIMGVFCLLSGVLIASKQTMFEPLFVSAVVLIFNFYLVRPIDIGLCLVSILLTVFVLTPLSNHGRFVYSKNNLPDTFSSLMEYLDKNFSSYQNYKAYQEELETTFVQSDIPDSFYFDFYSPLLERLSLLNAADQLLSPFQYRGPEGFSFLTRQFYLLPRALTGAWIQNEVSEGDKLGKISGLVNEDDDITSIAFGFFAESYAIAGWWGIILTATVMVPLFFIILRSIDVPYGDRMWTAFLVAYLQNLFSEGGLISLCMTMARFFPLLFILKKLTEVLELGALDQLSERFKRVSYN